jgi:hypothetical protein
MMHLDAPACRLAVFGAEPSILLNSERLYGRNRGTLQSAFTGSAD